jgi:hypothetical protein
MMDWSILPIFIPPRKSVHAAQLAGEKDLLCHALQTRRDDAYRIGILMDCIQCQKTMTLGIRFRSINRKSRKAA